MHEQSTGRYLTIKLLQLLHLLLLNWTSFLRRNFFENYIAFTRCHALLFFSLGHLHFILLLFMNFVGLNFLDLFNLKHTVRTIQPCTSLILYFIKRIKMGENKRNDFLRFFLSHKNVMHRLSTFVHKKLSYPKTVVCCNFSRSSY